MIGVVAMVRVVGLVVALVTGLGYGEVMVVRVGDAATAVVVTVWGRDELVLDLAARREELVTYLQHFRRLNLKESGMCDIICITY